MDKQELLKQVKEKMNADKTLPLRSGATNLVFGDGDANANVMFIGEGPGFWEDKKGIPFVGNAGAFLNQLLVHAGLERSKVFITNVVHFRPPENRDPEPVEIEAFGKYLDEILDIIKPKIIVTLGRFSMGKFLPGVRISSVHGKSHVVDLNSRQAIVVPMYHPAAGLRATAVKMQTIEDFKNLKKIIEEIENKKTEVKEEKVEQMELI